MINCTITSPEETMQYRQLENVTLPAFLGEMEVLSGHAEVFVLLKRGEIVLGGTNGQKKILEIPGGQCHIKDDNIIIIL